MQDLVADYGAPYLHCATVEAMVERVRDDRWRLRNVFQVCPSDVNYGPRFLSDLERTRLWTPSTRRVLVIQPRWSRMDIGFQTLERFAPRGGWSIDLLDDLPLRNIDWAQVMDKAHRRPAAAIFLAYYFPEENIAFLREFLSNPARAFVYTLYGPSVPRRAAASAGSAGSSMTSPPPSASSCTRRSCRRFRRPGSPAIAR